jgi:hypothetical protein
MRLVSVLLWAVLVLVATGFGASAATYEYHPSGLGLQTLAHEYVYTWGVNTPLAAGEVITGATLDMYNVYDAVAEPANNALFIHLLDNPALGVNSWRDGQVISDDLIGNPWIGTYVDPDGPATRANLHYDLAALGLLGTLNGYAANGVLGVGFDPDCAFYDTGVKLTLITGFEGQGHDTPEPSTLLLLATGAVPMLGLALRRRTRRQA